MPSEMTESSDPIVGSAGVADADLNHSHSGYPMQSGIPYASNRRERTERPANRICGAECRDGKPCNAWRMLNGRCRMHGGNSRFGWSHPAYTYGLHSKYFFIRHAGVARALEEAGVANPIIASQALEEHLALSRYKWRKAREAGKAKREVIAARRASRSGQTKTPED